MPLAPIDSSRTASVDRLENSVCFESTFRLSHPPANRILTRLLSSAAYFFVTREEMQRAIDNDEFIEHAEYSGNMYGTR